MAHSQSAKIARSALDPLWQTIREEVAADVQCEPVLASFLHATVLNHKGLEDALGFLLAGKLECSVLPAMLVRELIADAVEASPGIGQSMRADIRAIRDRDPAAKRFSEPFLYFKGFHALQTHRVAHWLWHEGREALALFLQNRTSEVFGVDIHPAARVGNGILIDHATSVVVGETAVIEDNVSILHEVTLGGTGKAEGDRHPKVRHGVLIGAGAKILGNVEVGRGAKVGAGSVVLEDVPPHCTVAGVPAIIIGRPDVDEPALEMDHRLPCNPDVEDCS
ncbi:MAG: serine O-acetyltransferase [Gammaproteobacteria bacterium]|nr:serine O-acetyltransferase [Gammaproteobacteria bacterium]MDX2461972.1 serine O-acetyltransferase [Gammaproteobacteria bacterium]